MADLIEGAKELQKKVDELEKLAFAGAEMPKGLGSSLQSVFLRFRHLYQFAKAVQMPPEQGRREKQDIIEALMVDIVNDNLYASAGQLWRNVETTVAEIRKTPEVAEIPLVKKLLHDIYGGVEAKEGGSNV